MPCFPLLSVLVLLLLFQSTLVLFLKMWHANAKAHAKAEINGIQRLYRGPKRQFILRELISSTHIALGFTSNGQTFLVYKFEDHQIHLLVYSVDYFTMPWKIVKEIAISSWHELIGIDFHFLCWSYDHLLMTWCFPIDASYENVQWRFIHPEYTLSTSWHLAAR